METFSIHLICVFLYRETLVFVFYVNLFSAFITKSFMLIICCGNTQKKDIKCFLIYPRVRLAGTVNCNFSLKKCKLAGMHAENE